MSFRRKIRVKIKKSNLLKRISVFLTERTGFLQKSNLQKKEVKTPGHRRTPYIISERASLSASLTVEASLVLPVFFYLMIGVLGFVQFMGQAGSMEQALYKTALLRMHMRRSKKKQKV